MTGDRAETPALAESDRRRIADRVKLRVSRHRRNRRIVISAAVAVVVGIGGTGAAWVVLAPPVVRDRQVACYPAADEDSRPATAQRSLTDVVDHAASDALDTCRLLWQLGVVRRGTTIAPALQLCVENDGTFAVFPDEHRPERSNRAFCDALALGSDPRASR